MKVTLSLKRPALYAPRGPRTAVNIGASLLLTDDRVSPVAIKILSPQGFMGETPHELTPGTWVGAELVGFGIVRARVRWSEAGETGCEFRAPLDRERLDRVLVSPPKRAGLFGHGGEKGFSIFDDTGVTGGDQSAPRC